VTELATSGRGPNSAAQTRCVSGVFSAIVYFYD